MFANDCVKKSGQKLGVLKPFKKLLQHLRPIGNIINQWSNSQKEPKKAKAWYCGHLIPTYESVGAYLGCKNIDRKRAKKDLAIKGTISSKLAGCKARVLSQASKLVLVKSNLPSISLFTMQE